MHAWQVVVVLAVAATGSFAACGAGMCANGGTCVEYAWPSSASLQCLCTAGFMGDACETPVPALAACTASPCDSCHGKFFPGWFFVCLTSESLVCSLLAPTGSITLALPSDIVYMHVYECMRPRRCFYSPHNVRLTFRHEIFRLSSHIPKAPFPCTILLDIILKTPYRFAACL